MKTETDRHIPLRPLILLLGGLALTLAVAVAVDPTAGSGRTAAEIGPLLRRRPGVITSAPTVRPDDVLRTLLLLLSREKRETRAPRLPANEAHTWAHVTPLVRLIAELDGDRD